MRIRYERLQGAFDREYRKNQKTSGVGGENGEIEELLMVMRDTRNNLLQQRKMEKWPEKSMMILRKFHSPSHKVKVGCISEGAGARIARSVKLGKRDRTHGW